MGCNLDLTPTWSVGFREVGQIKVGTEKLHLWWKCP